MSNEIKDGGPAFPLQSIGPFFPPGYSGMTLRDYFAGQALAGRAALLEPGVRYSDDVCRECYRLADDMLKAREDAS